MPSIRRLLRAPCLLLIVLLLTACDQLPALLTAQHPAPTHQPIPTLHLRTTPTMLASHADIIDWLRAYGFHYPGLINTGDEFLFELEGDFEQSYSVQQLDGVPVVIEQHTGLMWQQALSDLLDYDNAVAYVAQLNAEQYAGFTDWRMPTLEELASLLEFAPQNGVYIIDPVFAMGATEYCFWSADQKPSGLAWVVSFTTSGLIYEGYTNWYDGYVRAVRSVN